MPSTVIGAAARQLVQEECLAIANALATRSDIHVGVHSARKAIRRLRAVLALSATEEHPLHRTDRALQRLGRGLSALRDAHVLVETAQSLQAGAPAPGWAAVITHLRARRDRLLQRAFAQDPGFQKKQHVVQRVGLELDAQRWELVRKGDLRRALARSRRRVKKAAARARDSDDPETLHDWRRRVRRLRMQLEVMARLDSNLVKDQPGSDGGKHAKGLRRLSDALGREQDLRLLRNQIRAMPGLQDKAELMALAR